MTDLRFATTPAPPYYVAIFTSLRTPDDDSGYAATADRKFDLARERPGYLGVEATRGDDGFGITVSYWESEAAIAGWRADAEHRVARETGRRDWYQRYELRVGKVERARAWAGGVGYSPLPGDGA